MRTFGLLNIFHSFSALLTPKRWLGRVRCSCKPNWKTFASLTEVHLLGQNPVNKRAALKVPLTWCPRARSDSSSTFLVLQFLNACVAHALADLANSCFIFLLGLLLLFSCAWPASERGNSCLGFVVIVRLGYFVILVAYCVCVIILLVVTSRCGEMSPGAVPRREAAAARPRRQSALRRTTIPKHTPYINEHNTYMYIYIYI